ncbi:MAG: hypothetical protein PPP58_07360 [Natronomonas sp.]
MAGRFGLLGAGWTVWKIASKRLGPVGGAVVALVSVVGFALLRNYLAERYPRLGAALDDVV